MSIYEVSLIKKKIQITENKSLIDWFFLINFILITNKNVKIKYDKLSQN